MESSDPQASEAHSTPAPSGACTMAAALGRHTSSIPLRDEDRIRLKTPWNGNGDLEVCINEI